MNTMVLKRYVACALMLVLLLVQVVCSANSLIMSEGAKKLSAAGYYCDQRDYPNTRKTVLKLWRC